VTVQPHKDILAHKADHFDGVLVGCSLKENPIRVQYHEYYAEAHKLILMIVVLQASNNKIRTQEYYWSLVRRAIFARAY
jgi:hypothetical protein